MDIRDSSRSDISVVKLGGRLIATNAGSIKEHVRGLLDRGARRLVFDLTDVEFVDSLGLGALVACLRAASRSGGDIKVASIHPEIMKVFQLTKLNKVFDIYETVDMAMEDYRHRR